ncbi:hypothetical protein J6590_057953 [Homalodisca vitripennis]|nr:hypothetical protein J6590_057953 [Homalodisca vitripennis]
MSYCSRVNVTGILSTRLIIPLNIQIYIEDLKNVSLQPSLEFKTAILRRAAGPRLNPCGTPHYFPTLTYISLIKAQNTPSQLLKHSLIVPTGRVCHTYGPPAASRRKSQELGSFLKNMAAGNERIILRAPLMNPIRQKAFFSEGEEEGEESRRRRVRMCDLHSRCLASSYFTNAAFVVKNSSVSESGRERSRVSRSTSGAHVSVGALLQHRLLFLLARQLLVGPSKKRGVGSAEGSGRRGGTAAAHHSDLQCANKFSAEVKVSPSPPHQPPSPLPPDTDQTHLFRKQPPMHGIMKERFSAFPPARIAPHAATFPRFRSAALRSKPEVWNLSGTFPHTSLLVLHDYLSQRRNAVAAIRNVRYGTDEFKLSRKYVS